MSVIERAQGIMNYNSRGDIKYTVAAAAVTNDDDNGDNTASRYGMLIVNMALGALFLSLFPFVQQ